MDELLTWRALTSLLHSGASMALSRSGAWASASCLTSSSVEYFGETASEGIVDCGIIQIAHGIRTERKVRLLDC